MTTPLRTLLSICIQPMDMGNIADVAAALPLWGDPAYSQDELLEYCVERRGLGLVAWKAVNGVPTVVAGYCVFRRRTNSIYLHHVEVSPEFRRCGVGRDLLNRVTAIASPVGPQRVFCDAMQDALPAHLFLKACGFRAVSVNPVTYRFRFDASARDY